MLLAAVCVVAPIFAQNPPGIVPGQYDPGAEDPGSGATLTCAGSLDTSFSIGDGVRTAQGYANEAELEHLLPEPNGSLLIYGSFWLVQGEARRGLARLRPNGGLDPDFEPELHGTVVRAVARQPNGCLIVAGDFTAVGRTWRPRIARLEADGSLDWGFQPESDVDFGEIRALALQPDGKIIVAGSGMATWQATNLIVLRLEPRGTLDKDFVLTTGFVGQVRAIAVQPDGKILLGGSSRGFIPGSPLLLVRLNADGTPDRSFAWPLQPNDGVSALALQPDGRILVGGVLQPAPGEPGLGLVRLNPDGALDPTFNSEVRLCGDCDVRTLALDPQGRILIGGRFDRLNDTYQTLVARVNPDGTLDSTFQASMYKYPETGEGEFVSSMALQPDGRLLIAGFLTLINGHEVRSAARLFTTRCDCPSLISLTASGYWVDEAAGEAQITVARTGNLTRTAAVEYVVAPYPFQPPGSATPGADFAAPDGTLVFGQGESNRVLRVPIFNDQMAEATERFTVVLHRPTAPATLGRITEATVVIVDDETAGLPGSVDRSFRLAVELGHAGTGVSHLLALPDGGMLLAGDIARIDGIERFGLARLHADSSLDVGFASVIEGPIRAVARLASGDILIGGDFTHVNGVERARLARLHADGSLDTAFAPQFDKEVLALAVQPDGKLLVGGQFTLVNGSWLRNGLARFEANGSVDTGFDVGSGPRFGDYPGFVNNLLALPEGGILVGGVFTHFNGVQRQHLARLTDVGEVDPSFDPEATRLCSGLFAMARQPDGKLLLSGHFSLGDLRGLIRLHPSGTLDESFAIEQPYLYVNAFALQPDGCILIGGSFRVPDGGPMVGLARLREDGSLERSFFAGEGAGYGLVYSLAVLPNGQILAGGVFEGFNALPHANLVRLNGNPGGIAPFVIRKIAGYSVHLTATPPLNVASYTVEDKPLFGPVAQISEGGVYYVATGRVRFGPFTDHQPRTLSYMIVVPDGDCLRPSTISGFVEADAVQLPVLGDSVVGLDGLFPADLGPRDGRVSRAEAESYAAAWRYGNSWPEGPHPIPIECATRALTLGLGNDAYWFETRADTNHPALSWLNFGAPFPQCVWLPEPLPSGTATRQAPSLFLPGVSFTVTIHVAPAEQVTSYAVEEEVPWDWRPQADAGGVYDGWNNKLKWGPFADRTPRTFSYALTPPDDPWQGQCTFGGTVCFDGVNAAIAGGGTAHATCRLEAVFEAQLGRVRLALEGVEHATYVIEASSDLVTWEDVLIVPNVAGRMEFYDPAALSTGHRFYRARTTP
jgi:uncharacterized delta-60 repeat protein